MTDIVKLDEDTIKALAAALSGGGGTGKALKFFDVDNLEAFSKQMKRFTEDLKKTAPAQQTFREFLTGTKKDLVDVSHELEELEKAIKKAVAAEQDAKGSVDEFAKSTERAALQNDRDNLAKAAATKNMKTAFSNLAVGLGEVAGTMLTGAMQFARGLQSGQDPLELFGNTIVKANEAAGQFAKAIGDFMSAASGIAAVASIFVPWLRPLRMVIGGLGLLGVGISETAGALTKATVEIQKFFIDELVKTRKGFEAATSAGASFAGGMGELRAAAASAGLDVGQFGQFIKDNQSNLALMGVGISAASKRLTGVSKALQDSGLDQQLRNLGYNTQQQLDLIAFTGSQIGSARLLTMGNKELAATTLEYGKNLRVIADFTGEDAKKRLDKAREQAMEADVLLKAMQLGGKGGVDRLTAILATTPDVLKKGLLEKLSGNTITDPVTALMMNFNPKIAGAFDQLIGIIGDGNKTYDDATALSMSLNAGIAKYQTENLEGVGQLARNARLSGDATQQGIADFANQLIQFNRKLESPKAAKNMAENVEAAARSTEALQKTVNQIDKNAQDLRAALGEKLTPAILKFAEEEVRAFNLIKATNDALGKYGLNIGANANQPPAPTGINFGEVAKSAGTHGLAGMVGGGAMGLLAGGATAPLTAAAGGIGGAIIGAGKSLYNQLFGSNVAGGAQSGLTTDYSGLTLGGAYPGEATGGGPAQQQIIEAARRISAAYPGTVVNALNDITHQQRYPNSKHTQGKAADLQVPGLNKNMLDQINSMVAGMAKAEIHKNDSGTGEHLHLEMLKNGGITNGPSIAGEAGPEAVIPLPDGRSIPVTMDNSALIDKISEMISIMKDHRDISEKTMWASA
jgi:archaellum component FlaC